MSRSVPACSIVVRCCNEERHIGRLLDGILSQTIADVEIVVVDSGSSDRTVEIARRYPVELVQIRPEDFSFGHSLNVGCRHAHGDLFVLASAHVYPTAKNWVERLLAPFSDPAVALVYGRQRGGTTTRFSENQVFRAWFPEHSDPSQSHPFCNNANAAIRRSVWEQIPYDETLTGLEDIAWARTALGSGHRIVYCAEAEVVHVHEETSGQIFRRYEREAIALKRLYPHHRFGLGTFLRLASGNVLADWCQAWRESTLLRTAFDIVLFRTLQFWGAYRGHALRGPVSDELRTRFYFPPSHSTRRERSVGAESLRYTVTAAQGNHRGWKR